jgi:PIN domain nuclease of toxin-antitoxin system
VSEAVLDSSVILAILKDEAFDAMVYDAVDGGVMSAVNLTEVYSKLSDLKLAVTPRVDALIGTLSRIEPFNESQARLAADLRPITRHAGLSLGDRACLALALEIGAEVYTTEGQWARVDPGCKVHLIR